MPRERGKKTQLATESVPVLGEKLNRTDVLELVARGEFGVQGQAMEE